MSVATLAFSAVRVVLAMPPTPSSAVPMDVVCAKGGKNNVQVAREKAASRSVQPTRTVSNNLVLFLVVDHDLQATLSRENFTALTTVVTQAELETKQN
tara:strand:+ start:213 stop:506 length:294 start_codon:yes stop_codon:yes gene_type:complete